ncbi:MAG: reprolysin-like metallopeptidase [Anaerolineae bacterium]
MRRMSILYILILLAATALPSLAAAPAQQAAGVWFDVNEPTGLLAGPRQIVPQQYRTVGLKVDALQAVLAAAPDEFTAEAATSSAILALPLPQGGYARFRLVESPVMASELAAKFPEISTYAGQGVDDPTASVRLDWTPAGFHAMLFTTAGVVYIDPYSQGDTEHYISYYKRDFLPGSAKQYEEIPPLPSPEALPASTGVQASTGPQLRTYRLALAATGEYTAFHGGTVAGAMAAIVTSVNRVDGVYEREVAVRMVLVANNNLIVYTNASTDPYTNSNGSTMLSQNQTNVDSVIGSANYDIGHVFSTGGGGVAYLGVVCQAGSKARGVTGSSAPVGDPYDIDYVAHEMGHQFAGNHSFNGNAGSCGGGNRNASTAYEPGSGSTIMAYAGICGAQDLQPHSDDYFHGINFDEIVAYTTTGAGNSCPTITNTGNSAPAVTVPAGGFTIPSRTPFQLTGSASDPNGDALTYNWEEFDLGTAGAPNNAATPPFFRSWPSLTGPTRVFPRLSDLVNNTTVIGEILPNATRSMTYRLTARDNRTGGGGVNYAAVTFNVTTAAGPFQVTAPNTAVVWTGNTTQTVTWDVANTTSAPVNCPLVNVTLSTDGGYTYPLTLASSVANDGSEQVTAPNIGSTSARVRVACANNIFFDISNVNFTINAAACFWADVNCSCGITSTTIDVADVVAVANAWTAYHDSSVYAQAADIDCRASGGCDGANDILDLGVLSSVWGMACPVAHR